MLAPERFHPAVPRRVPQKIFVDHDGRPVKRLYQAWDQNAVESETYRLLREARQAGINSGATAAA